MEMEWNDTQFHVTSIFCRKSVVLCTQMGKLLLNALHHCFGNGLFTFLPVILHAIFPDFTAYEWQWLCLISLNILRLQDSVWLWKELHRCVAVTQLQQSLRPKDSKSLDRLLLFCFITWFWGHLQRPVLKANKPKMCMCWLTIFTTEYSYCYIFK